MKQFIDLTNKRFGKLTVLYFNGKEKKNNRWLHNWMCFCDCGKEVIKSDDTLKRGTKSCSCLAIDKVIILGTSRSLKSGSRHPLHKYIVRAYKRCNNKNNKNYYKKGIKFKFNSILEGIKYVEKNLGLPPTSKHTLDRYPNTKGHYEPNNLRWATSSQQNHNQIFRKSKTGIKGVEFCGYGKFKARIKYKGKTYKIGVFKTAKLASLAYQACAWVLYG